MKPASRSERRRLGPYELVLEVGYGGMGSVYVGRRAGPGGFHKWVALKTIHPHLAKEQAFVDMFLDEARVAAAMQHPNVAQVFELGEHEGTYYLTMEYLHGEHIGGLLEYAGDGHEPRLVARILSLAAQGLHHAHEAVDARGAPLNLVHRDVSPQNIFLTYAGHVKVTDFGIARAEGRLLKTTDTGRIKGKCAYMAPEQITGQLTDPRADLFALAVVGWELLAGRRLFASDTDAETLLKISQADIPPLSSKRQDIPPALDAIIHKALEYDRDARFDSAGAMAEALELYIAESGPPIAPAQLGALMDTCFADERRDKERLLESEHEVTGERAAVPDAQKNIETVEAEAAGPGNSGAPVEAEAQTVLAAATPGSAAALTPIGGRRFVGLLAVVVIAFAGAMVAFFPTIKGLSEVRVDSEPSGATLLLDSEPVQGTTPIVLHDVERGRHTLSLSREGFEPIEVGFDADRREIELSYPLRAAEPTANIVTEVMERDATVEPAEDAGVTATVEEATVDVTPETLRSRRGRRPHAASAMDANPTMEPTPEAPAEAPTGRARLNLITSPWATVRINGRDAGSTPLYQHSIPAGTLRVELRARGEGAIVRRTLQATAGETLSTRVELPE